MIPFDPTLICPLCGIKPALHNGRKYTKREHVPPACIFPKSAGNLITLPSCADCNYGTHLEDEKFKIALGIYIGSSNIDLWKRTLATLNKTKKLKLNLLNNLISLPGPYRKTPGGTIKMDKKIIRQSCKKLIRGLHYHIKKQVLPSNINPKIALIKQGKTLNHHTKMILDKFGKSINTGNGIFEARYAYAEDHEFASIWLFRFYKEDCFVATI